MDAGRLHYGGRGPRGASTMEAIRLQYGRSTRPPPRTCYLHLCAVASSCAFASSRTTIRSCVYPPPVPSSRVCVKSCVSALEMGAGSLSIVDGLPPFRSKGVPAVGFGGKSSQNWAEKLRPYCFRVPSLGTENLKIHDFWVHPPPSPRPPRRCCLAVHLKAVWRDLSFVTIWP
jgi:hypothetical protein